MTWDDPGGFFDHVVPPMSAPHPDNQSACFCSEQGECQAHDPRGYDPYTRLGSRVPVIVASPWIKKGTVVSEPEAAHKPFGDSRYDGTSLVATIKRLFGLPSFPTKRDAWSAPFDHLFEELAAPRTDTPVHLPDAPAPTPRPGGHPWGTDCDDPTRRMRRSIASFEHLLEVAAPPRLHECAASRAALGDDVRRRHDGRGDGVAREHDGALAPARVSGGFSLSPPLISVPRAAAWQPVERARDGRRVGKGKMGGSAAIRRATRLHRLPKPTTRSRAAAAQDGPRARPSRRPPLPVVGRARCERVLPAQADADARAPVLHHRRALAGDARPDHQAPPRGVDVHAPGPARRPRRGRVRRGELLFQRASAAKDELLGAVRQAAAAREAESALAGEAGDAPVEVTCSTLLDAAIYEVFAMVADRLSETGAFEVGGTAYKFVVDIVTLEYDIGTSISLLLLLMALGRFVLSFLGFLKESGPLTTLASVATTLVVGPLPTVARFVTLPALRLEAFVRDDLLPLLDRAGALASGDDEEEEHGDDDGGGVSDDDGGADGGDGGAANGDAADATTEEVSASVAAAREKMRQRGGGEGARQRGGRRAASSKPTSPNAKPAAAAAAGAAAGGGADPVRVPSRGRRRRARRARGALSAAAAEWARDVVARNPVRFAAVDDQGRHPADHLSADGPGVQRPRLRGGDGAAAAARPRLPPRDAPRVPRRRRAAAHVCLLVEAAVGHECRRARPAVGLVEPRHPRRHKRDLARRELRELRRRRQRAALRVVVRRGRRAAAAAEEILPDWRRRAGGRAAAHPPPPWPLGRRRGVARAPPPASARAAAGRSARCSAGRAARPPPSGRGCWRSSC